MHVLPDRLTVMHGGLELCFACCFVVFCVQRSCYTHKNVRAHIHNCTQAAKKLGSKEERRRARKLAKREARRPRTQLELLIMALEEEGKGLDDLLKQVWSG